MTDAPPEGGGLAPPGSESRHIEDTEPWNRFSVVNFQDRLTQPQPRAQLPKSHSVFGVDKVMQSELAKLESQSFLT